MNRIVDFTLSDEESVVSRILVQVHKAVDKHFPSAEAANRKFTKTVFSEEDSSSTAMLKVPSEDEQGQFEEEENTQQTEVSDAENSPDNNHDPAEDHQPEHSGLAGQIEEGETQADKADWVSRVAVVLLLTGLIILAYILYFT